MSLLRLLAEQLQLSRATVSAALRGMPRVEPRTRDRVLRCAARVGYRCRSEASHCLGKIAILRVKAPDPRGRPAVERHRAILRGARTVAFELGYRVEEVSLPLDEVESLAAAIQSGGFLGVVILPGPEAEALLERCPPAIPCVYTDIVSEGIPIQAVCPDYRQAMNLALLRLRASGFKNPGLMLDAGLSLLTRERLLSAYGSNVGSAGTFAPRAFFTPARTASSFETWLTRHSFDALISTDEEQASRLLPHDVAVPIFGLKAGQTSRAGGIDFNFATVGRRAVETLHRRLKKGGRSPPVSQLSVAAVWSDPKERVGAGSINREHCRVTRLEREALAL